MRKRARPRTRSSPSDCRVAPSPAPVSPAALTAPGRRGANPQRAAAYAAPPVRMSKAPGCASAPHVVFAGVCGHDPRRRRCATRHEAKSSRFTATARRTTAAPGEAYLWLGGHRGHAPRQPRGALGTGRALGRDWALAARGGRPEKPVLHPAPRSGAASQCDARAGGRDTSAAFIRATPKSAPSSAS